MGHERRPHALLFSPVKVGPASPMILDLQVDPEFQEEGDTRLFVPAEPGNPRVRRVLEHLVRGPCLSAEESQIEFCLHYARGDAVRKDLAVAPRESPELLVLHVAHTAYDG